MYIRRKVFSTYIDEETGEERLYSTTEIMSEESYLEKLYSENEPEQKEFNSKAQKALRKVYDSAVGKKATNSNTLYNLSRGREELRKSGEKGVNASINEKALVNGSDSIRAKLPYKGGIRGAGKKFWAGTEYDHDHVYKPTSEVIKSAKEIMKKNK